VAETKGIVQYEVELQKACKKDIVALNVAVVRGPRGKKKMVGESATKSPSLPYIWFKITSAATPEEVYHEFLRLVVHRGYLPLRVLEIKDGLRGKWTPCDTTGIDGIEEVLQNETRAEANAGGTNR
jgi:hypothetical protein